MTRQRSFGSKSPSGSATLWRSNGTGLCRSWAHRPCPRFDFDFRCLICFCRFSILLLLSFHQGVWSCRGSITFSNTLGALGPVVAAKQSATTWVCSPSCYDFRHFGCARPGSYYKFLHKNNKTTSRSSKKLERDQ